jgi:hypothetical protein
MKKRRILFAVLFLLGLTGTAQAAPVVTFDATDNPGSWFHCHDKSTSSAVGCVPELDALGTVGQKSLAIIRSGESVGFASTGNANTIHTAVSLMYPHQATSMPFNVDLETAALEVRERHLKSH